MMGENEERPAIGAAEQELQRPLRDINLADLLAFRRIDKNLAVGDIDIPMAINGDALSAALRKWLQVRECPVGVHLRTIGDIFRLAADIDTPSRRGKEEPVRVEVVAEAPARCIVRRALLEDADRG